MFVKVKAGRLKDLSARLQRFLIERKRYFAQDVGTGIVIQLNDENTTLDFFIDNRDLERKTETKPHRPFKEYVYSLKKGKLI